MADALDAARYDAEYLEEMKGIADGAAKAGAKFDGRAVDLLDVVTLNSVDRPRPARRAPCTSTPNAVTGRSFLTAEDETTIPDRSAQVLLLRGHRARHPRRPRSSSASSSCGTATPASTST